MLSEKEFLREEKQCADLLGMTLEEYSIYKNNVKVPNKKNKRDNKKKEYDNSILGILGLSSKDLKRKAL